ncbi:hypothetical protein Ntsu_07080 [Nocardia sp. IFM 10818]
MTVGALAVWVRGRLDFGLSGACVGAGERSGGAPACAEGGKNRDLQAPNPAGAKRRQIKHSHERFWSDCPSSLSTAERNASADPGNLTLWHEQQ